MASDRSDREERPVYQLPVADLCLEFNLDLALTPTDLSPRIHPEADEVVSSMPTVSTSGVCTVCMEEYDEGKRTPCCHVYHAACISSWLAAFDSCPLCRCRIRPEEA